MASILVGKGADEKVGQDASETPKASRPRSQSLEVWHEAWRSQHLKL